MGMLGIKQFTAVINPPQATILAVGRVAPLNSWSVRRHRVSTSRIGLVPLEPDGERLVAYLERRTPWDS